MRFHRHNMIEPASKPITAVTSLAETRAMLTALHARENDLVSRLNALLVSGPDVNRDLSRLDILSVVLGTQVIATHSISNALLASAADTARMLSDQIRKLDLE
jgi:hypothetical protein